MKESLDLNRDNSSEFNANKYHNTYQSFMTIYVAAGELLSTLLAPIASLAPFC